MWIKKTPEEIKNTKPTKAVSFTYAFIMSLFLFVFTTVIYKIGYNKYKSDTPKTWHETWAESPRFFGFSLVFFIFAYILQGLGFMGKSDDEAKLCTTCDKIFKNSSATTCECGQPLFIVRDYKWVEENQDNNKN